MRATQCRQGLLLLMLAGTAIPVLAEPPPRFPPGASWNREIVTASVHPQSAGMIATLQSLGGFGLGRMQIDFSIHVVRAAAGAPTRTIIGYPSPPEYYSPDCEPIGSSMPVPANAAIEGNPGLTCDNANEDCHLLVVQGNTLYEAYRANASGANGLEAQCLAVWNLDVVYPPEGRGDHCTSADAAGLPMSALLFNADEVFDAIAVPGSDLGHAIRFILPNSRMASDPSLGGVGGRLYVRPATHAGGPSGPAGSVPYGARLRLRSNFPVNLYNPGAQVVLRTLQRYGMILSDGGNVALTAESDLFTTHDWSEVGIDSQTFFADVPSDPVRVTDFEVVWTGPRIAETFDCERTVFPLPYFFSDGFENP